MTRCRSRSGRRRTGGPGTVARRPRSSRARRSLRSRRGPMASWPSATPAGTTRRSGSRADGADWSQGDAAGRHVPPRRVLRPDRLPGQAGPDRADRPRKARVLHRQRLEGAQGGGLVLGGRKAGRARASSRPPRRRSSSPSPAPAGSPRADSAGPGCRPTAARGGPTRATPGAVPVASDGERIIGELQETTTGSTCGCPRTAGRGRRWPMPATWPRSRPGTTGSTCLPRTTSCCPPGWRSSGGTPRTGPSPCGAPRRRAPRKLIGRRRPEWCCCSHRRWPPSQACGHRPQVTSAHARGQRGHVNRHAARR